MRPSQIDVHTQTDEDLLYNYAWQKYYHHFKAAFNEPECHKQNESDGIEILDSKSIQNIAEQALQSTGYVYDTATNYYYDAKNKFYYNQVSSVD
jgi:hypothetical protein